MNPKTRKTSESTFETPEFRALQRQWYAKLKADGFDDIEANDPVLKNDDWSSLVANFTENRIIAAEASQNAEVYRFAEQWVNRYRWMRRRDRFAFLLWSECVPLPDYFPSRGYTRNLRKGLVREMLATMRAEGDAVAEELVREIDLLMGEEDADAARE